MMINKALPWILSSSINNANSATRQGSGYIPKNSETFVQKCHRKNKRRKLDNDAEIDSQTYTNSRTSGKPRPSPLHCTTTNHDPDEKGSISKKGTFSIKNNKSTTSRSCSHSLIKAGKENLNVVKSTESSHGDGDGYFGSSEKGKMALLSRPREEKKERLNLFDDIFDFKDEDDDDDDDDVDVDDDKRRDGKGCYGKDSQNITKRNGYKSPNFKN
eukprot:Awhi_evm1s8770